MSRIESSQKTPLPPSNGAKVPTVIPPAPQVPSADPKDAVEASRMTIFDHLNELRSRLFKAALALVFGTAIGMAISGQVLLFLKQPYGAQQFVVLGPTDSVVAYFRVALLVGGIISIPVITYQVLSFIVPGLTSKERRIILAALPGITLLFLIGVVFTWMVLIPPAIGFFNNFMPEVFISQWTADRYLGFVTALLFWMGVAFETPLVFFVLAILGMVTQRTLIRNWRIAIVGSAVAAAIITPTVDPVNMFLVMGPLLVLYVISIVLVGIGRRFAKLSDTA
jgi:sec-independent protein translocase protein TatC